MKITICMVYEYLFDKEIKIITIQYAIKITITNILCHNLVADSYNHKYVMHHYNI